MLGKSFLAVAALGVVSLWFVRSRAASLSSRLSGSGAGALPRQGIEGDSPNAAERLQHSHAMGVRNGIEGPLGPNLEGASTETAGDATVPGSREFLRGA